MGRWAGAIERRQVQWPEDSISVTAQYRSLEIECYDDNDHVVPKWPVNNNADYRNAIKYQPIRGIMGEIPETAQPGFNGEIPNPNTPDPPSTNVSEGLKEDNNAASGSKKVLIYWQISSSPFLSFIFTKNKG
jgi:hypothetical protein